MVAPPSSRILVVEDETHIAAALKLNFELEGYEVVVVASAREAAKRLLDSRPFDAMILDLMLPDADGVDLCRHLRDAGHLTPILMLTALDTTEDRVRGLEAGADDYLVKPFELSELLARVRSMLRRRSWERESQSDDSERRGPPGSMTVGRAVVNFDGLTVHTVDGDQVHLTRLEFDLLRYFASNPQRVLSRQELQEKVWKLENYPNSRMVDNFVLRLRKHFELDPSSPKIFVSVRGAGYKFMPPVDADSR